MCACVSRETQILRRERGQGCLYLVFIFPVQPTGLNLYAPDAYFFADAVLSLSGVRFVCKERCERI